MIALASVCVACGCVLLAWAGTVLSNIWGYNDSGAVTYSLIAAILAIPGLALIGGGVLFTWKAPGRASHRAFLVVVMTAVLIALLLTSALFLDAERPAPR